MGRMKEHRGRPEALEKLEQVFNTSTSFLEKSKEFLVKPKPKVVETEKESTETDEKTVEEKASDPKPEKTEKVGEEGLFKQKELDALAKKIEEVKKWRDEKVAEQDTAPLNEMPKLTVSLINSKIHDLESEVQFLIQKAKMVKAEQERAKRKAEADAKKAEEEKKKQEKKAKKEKKKNESETTDDKSEEEPVKEEPEEELLELVPGLVWAVLKQGQEAETPSENLRPPTRPPRRPPHRPELEASLLETL